MTAPIEIDPNLVNPFELGYNNMQKLMQYKLPESEATFKSAFELYTKTLKGDISFEKGLNKLFLLRHDALMSVNKFLFDEDQEKLHDMKEDDVEGWAMYKQRAEEYRIHDFFFTRLIGIVNAQCSN